MNVAVDANQHDALHSISGVFCAASGNREEDQLSVTWRAYLGGKPEAQNGEKSSSDVGEHIYIGQFSDNTGLSYLNGIAPGNVEIGGAALLALSR